MSVVFPYPTAHYTSDLQNYHGHFLCLIIISLFLAKFHHKMAKFHHMRFLLEDEKDEQDYEFDCYSGCKQQFLSHSPSKTENISKLLIIVICVLCFVVFLFLAFFAIRRYRSRNLRRNNSPPLDHDQSGDDFVDELQGSVIDHPIWYIRTIGLPENVINSITVFKYQKHDHLIEKSDCSVCLNEFQEDESLRLLPKCSHAFHVTCIDTWLRSHKNCPVCRAPIVVENGSSDFVVNLNGTGSSEIEIEDSGEVRNVGEDLSAEEDDKLAETLSIECWENNGRNGEFRVVSDLGDHHSRVKVDRNFQPVRRSVSMDFSYVSMIFGGDNGGKIDEGCWDRKVEMDSNVNVIDKS